MSSAPHIGIDFGTSNSTVAWINPKSGLPEVIRNEHGEEKTPSVVYVGADHILVGKPALDQLADVALMDEEMRRDILGRTFTSIKRLLKDNLPLALPDGEIVTPVELASHILYALKQSAENGCFNGERITTATIAHPVVFGSKQIDNLKEAAGLAGFDQIYLVQEPVAAIHGYVNSGVTTGKGILVFDFGGGTLDLAYLQQGEDDEWEMPVPPIGEELGGDDFDRLIYEHFERELQAKHDVSFSPNGSHNLAVLHACRGAKEKLSSHTVARVSLLLPEQNLTVRFDLNRQGLNTLIDNDVAQAGNLTSRIIEQVASQDKDVDSVILIGGSARVRLIKEHLSRHLPIKPLATMHADVAVAMGAAGHKCVFNKKREVMPDQSTTMDLAEHVGPFSYLISRCGVFDNTALEALIINTYKDVSRGIYNVNHMLVQRFISCATILNNFPTNRTTLIPTGDHAQDDYVASCYIQLTLIGALIDQIINANECVNYMLYTQYCTWRSAIYYEPQFRFVLRYQILNEDAYPEIYLLPNGLWSVNTTISSPRINTMLVDGNKGVSTVQKYLLQYDAFINRKSTYSSFNSKTVQLKHYK